MFLTEAKGIILEELLAGKEARHKKRIFIICCGAQT
jgi:hypothetical protein